MDDPRPLHLLDATMFWNPSGGVRRYVTAKRRWLRRHAGWRHTVATPAVTVPAPAQRGAGFQWPNSQAGSSRSQFDGDEVLAIPSLPLPGSGGAYRLPWRRTAAAHVLAGARPDLIEAADPYRLAWSALDAARMLGVPAVAFCHSNLEQMACLVAGQRWGGAAAQAARRYARHLYNRFDLVLAPSEAMVAHLHDWGIPRAEHQPLGVDTRVFQPARRHRGSDPGVDLASAGDATRAAAEWRASLGLPADARLLVYAGRFAAEKNLQVLVDATRRLGAPHWLVAIGAGPVPPQGERVRVLPPIRNAAVLAGALASADVFVHAGDQETFGLSALEALACGVPVVARAAEGLAELVDEAVGHAVAAAPGASRAALAEAFSEAIADVLARDPEPLRQAARRRALAHDWEQVVPMLWHRYRRLLEAPLAPRP